MTCNRFQKLVQYFHVAERSTESGRGEQGYDPLFKVRPVMECQRSHDSIHRLPQPLTIQALQANSETCCGCSAIPGQPSLPILRYTWGDRTIKQNTDLAKCYQLLEKGLNACGTKPAEVQQGGDFKILQKADTNLTVTVSKDKQLVHHFIEQ
ncbi:hypothetical protein DPMN_041311 [Dreissena polymorpha]|uniref:Uncharacterized protein n=1 Tax=Dreissena polymorpha TaxID=45954 RepID=A0A9D4HXS0_DREPO|nr:hypothetical protein DPMN_041311 [Dreissena polymorpha]